MHSCNAVIQSFNNFFFTLNDYVKKSQFLGVSMPLNLVDCKKGLVEMSESWSGYRLVKKIR